MNLVLEMRRTCRVFLVTLLLLVSLVVPVTIPVVADEGPPMFTEEDCECAATGMEMTSCRVQSGMIGTRFQMDDGWSPRLSYETWWYRDAESCRAKYAKYLDPNAGTRNVAKMKEATFGGIEKGFNPIIFEDDFTNKDERASFIYGYDSGDFEGKRVFIYDDMYVTSIQAEYFESGIETKRAMDEIEKCIMCVFSKSGTNRADN